MGPDNSVLVNRPNKTGRITAFLQPRTVFAILGFVRPFYCPSNCGISYQLTFTLYGIDSKKMDVADTLFTSVIKPWVKLKYKVICGISHSAFEQDMFVKHQALRRVTGSRSHTKYG